MVITLKDGSKKEYEEAKSVIDIAYDISEGLAALRHTASHVLAEAVQKLYPDAKVAIGPSIDTGLPDDYGVSG